MTAPLALLDAASLYFRSFFALPDSLRAPDGTPVNAVRGFADTVARILTERRPRRLVACLDADWRPQFRVDLLPSYKAHRVAEEAAGEPDVEETPDALSPQVPIILELLEAVRLAPAHASYGPPGAHNRFFLTGLNRELLLYGKAVMWDLETQLRRTSTNQMTGLQPALSPTPTTTAPTLDSPLQALRLLRQASYSQARGQADASAASLHDLASLGERVATEIRDQLPQPNTGLARVEAAHLRDVLDEAHEAWAKAGTGLGQRVQSVTKAPAAYGSAITHLLQADHLSLPACTAVMAALPRMGNDGATTIRRLTRARLLAIATREPGRLSPTWRPLQALEADALAQRFTTAATTTSHAVDQVRRVAASPPTRRPAAPAPLPQRTRTQHRQVTHP
jgi:hypothetical protein